MNQILSDEEITLIVRECAKGSAINRDGSTSHRIARAIEQAILAKLNSAEPYKIKYPEYHHEAMGCGLEDRNITDRYEAMHYGWECAITRTAMAIPDTLYEHSPAPNAATLIDTPDDDDLKRKKLASSELRPVEEIVAPYKDQIKQLTIERNALLDALLELLLIVNIHQDCTGNRFAWAEIEAANEAIAKAKGLKV